MFLSLLFLWHGVAGVPRVNDSGRDCVGCQKIGEKTVKLLDERHGNKKFLSFFSSPFVESMKNKMSLR